jgi:nicotinate (nicotinamide) nucleotide adenylyltransferase
VKIGILAGAFNPVTRAHVALADAARAHVDEIVFAIPRAFPHKEFEGASLEHRVEMIRRASPHRVAITEGGLLIEIAREIRGSNPDAEVHLICGRDAAERIVEWKYDDPRMLNQMFEEVHLLVAARQGSYSPPAKLGHRIREIEVPGEFDDVSSSEVRRRILAGERWEHLVPEVIVDAVRSIYRVSD